MSFHCKIYPSTLDLHFSRCFASLLRTMPLCWTKSSRNFLACLFLDLIPFHGCHGWFFLFIYGHSILQHGEPISISVLRQSLLHQFFWTKFSNVLTWHLSYILILSIFLSSTLCTIFNLWASALVRDIHMAYVTVERTHWLQ